MTDISFRWLHFSDLHFGLHGQAPLWTNLKHHLYDDLPRLMDLTGAWDLVVFSGDIVQSGLAEEFAGATDALLELWERFGDLDCSPKFLAVPGNHDLARPSESEMTVMLLGRWSDNETVRRSFLHESTSDYRRTVLEAFERYQSWYESLGAAGIPMLDATNGFLPGDQFVRMQVEGGQVGIVGLNSAWLQLTGHAKEGDLHVDIAQLTEMLPDAEAWARENDFNLLVTHHPVEWFSADALDTWRSEIAPPGRFDLHLFGHMHEPLTRSLSVAGSSPVTTFQSSSLFGLEMLADGSRTRIHGFAAGELSARGTDRRLKIWPRTRKLLRSGQSKIVPDLEFDLSQDDSSLTTVLPARNAARHASRELSASTDIPSVRLLRPFEATSEVDPQGLLARFRHHLLAPGPHAFVRKVEQDAAADGLQKRCIWIIADWGLSSDEFVASVLERQALSSRSVYRVDLSEVSATGDLEQEIDVRLGVKVQALSEELVRQGEAMLILDDIQLGERTPGALPREVSIENIAQAILDYCPSLVMVLRTRSAPSNVVFTKTQIGSLDEADLKTYVAKHPDGGEDLAAPDVVDQLFSLTGGVPDRVDRTLEALKVVTLSELMAGEGEGLSKGDAASSLALQRAIGELRSEADPSLQRALQMLQVLATFPHGAQFEHIKRFHGVHGFYPDNATELMRRALITASTLPGLEPSSHAETRRILVVPRTVRDAVRGQMSSDELGRLNRRAAELYFSSDWRAGSTSWPSERKYSSPKCSHHEIANASAILLRLLRAAISEDDEHEIGNLFHLAAAYSKALLDGSHYYGCSSFCGFFLQIAPSGIADDMADLVRLNYGQSLRMVGERSKAIEQLEGLTKSSFDKSNRDRLLLGLALAYQGAGDQRATEVAQRLLRATKHGNYKLQARAIILDQNKEDPDRTASLIALENEARRKKAYVVANNIAISLAKETEDEESARRYLEKVFIAKGGTSDIYNEVRAAIDIAGRQLDGDGELSDFDHAKLISAYQYLFIQRIPALFDRCHRLLWQSFRQRNELSNLLALFRHSSFIWRVRGVAPKEESYLESISEMAGKDLAGIPSSRDGDYFKARFRASEPSPTIAIA